MPRSALTLPEMADNYIDAIDTVPFRTNLATGPPASGGPWPSLTADSTMTAHQRHLQPSQKTVFNALMTYVPITERTTPPNSKKYIPLRRSLQPRAAKHPNHSLGFFATNVVVFRPRWSLPAWPLQPGLSSLGKPQSGTGAGSDRGKIGPGWRGRWEE